MDRSRLGRGLAILAIAALAVAVVSPAFSAAPLTKAKVKKIAKKQIKNLVPDMIADADTLLEVGPIHQSVGSADVTIGTFGPFTLKTHCEDLGTQVEATVLISTSEADSTLQSYDHWTNFEPAEGFINFSSVVVGNGVGEEIEGWSVPYYYNGGHAIAPSGTSIIGVIDPITNFDGAHCYFDGFLQILTA